MSKQHCEVSLSKDAHKQRRSCWELRSFSSSY